MEEKILAYPLERKIDDIVISLKDRCLQSLIDHSSFNIETWGYLISAIYKDSLFLLGITTAGFGNSQMVELENSYFPMQNLFLRQAKKEIPSLTTVLYHNHPKPNLSELPVETIGYLKSGIEKGVYNYLRDYGIEPTVENAATEELTRQLSDSDIQHLSGSISVLLTNTARANHPFSSINAYRIDQRDPFFPERIRVRSLESKKIDYIKEYIKLTSKIDMIYLECLNQPIF